MKKLYQGQLVEVPRTGQKNTRIVFPDGKDALVPTEELKDPPNGDASTSPPAQTLLTAEVPAEQESSKGTAVESNAFDSTEAVQESAEETPIQDTPLVEHPRDESGYIMLNTSNYDAPGAAMSRRLGPVLHQQENPQYRSPRGVMPSHAKNHK